VGTAGAAKLARPTNLFINQILQQYQILDAQRSSQQPRRDEHAPAVQVRREHLPIVRGIPRGEHVVVIVQPQRERFDRGESLRVVPYERTSGWS
jgi:hypothetical protein